MNTPRLPHLPDTYDMIRDASIPFPNREPRLTIPQPKPDKPEPKSPPPTEDKK